MKHYQINNQTFGYKPSFHTVSRVRNTDNDLNRYRFFRIIQSILFIDIPQ